MSIQLEANRKAWIERFCPRQDGRSVSWRGSESLTSSPLREDRHPSFSVNIDQGTWHDFSTGEGGKLALLAKDIGAEPWPGDEGPGTGKASGISCRKTSRQKTAPPQATSLHEARTLWEGSTPASSDHPYLQARVISEIHDLRVDGNGWLLVPAYDAKGNIQAVQKISPKPGGPGEKWPKRNVGPIGGTLWPVGKMKPGPLVICEGPATAVTVRSLFDGGLVVCCFGSENVPRTASVAAVEGKREIILAVDADDAGRKAVDKSPDNCLACFPPEADMDWNDYARQKGIDAARKAFNGLMTRQRLLDEIKRSPAEKQIRTISATDLMSRDFRPIQWAIDQLIPPGLSVLAAPPKKGKSWLILQAALAVASGDLFLTMPTRKGPVLYCGLEDSPPRLQARMGLLLGERRAPSDLSLSTVLPQLDRGGLDWLVDWITVHHPRMVILDTWSKIKPRAEKGLNAYEADYAAIGPLKALADRTETAIVLVHHLKKHAGRDGTEDVESLSGSMGLPGAADSLLFLKRDQGDDAATLSRQGRDLSVDADIALAWTSPGWRTSTAAEALEAKIDALGLNERAIVDCLQREQNPCSPIMIAGLIGRKSDSVRSEIRRLRQKGLLKKDREGYYSLASAKEKRAGETSVPAVSDVTNVPPVTSVTLEGITRDIDVTPSHQPCHGQGLSVHQPSEGQGRNRDNRDDHPLISSLRGAFPSTQEEERALAKGEEMTL